MEVSLVRLRKSVALAVVGGGAVASTALVFLGVGLVTGGWGGALVVGLGVGAAVGTLGLILSRVNDRLGDVLAGQRRAAGRRSTKDTSPVKAPKPTGGAKAPAIDQGLVAMRALKALPKTQIGPGALADNGRRGFPIAAADLREWKESRASGHRPRLTVSAPSWGGGPFLNPAAVPVAMIADEFTFQSFAPEFDVHRLTPTDWRETCERVKPALFFCESAWSGGSPPERPWAGQIYATMAWPEERRRHLLEVLAYCRRNGIPSVFWNKEDPIHFPDRTNDFVRTAGLFDLVLTTAEECVELYERDAGVENADVLPFAVQPRIFNPLGVQSPKDAAVFAGTWYERYPKRAAALAQILDLVVSSGRELVIYDRQFHSPERYGFPARYDRYRRPAISYEQTADAYRDHLFGITLNTIVDSRTMFARRAFEMAACGQVVLSNSALGVESFFGDAVIYADREPSRFLELDDGDIAGLRRSALGIALRNTYAHRAVTVLERLGMKPAPVDQPPTLVVTVRSEEEYAEAARCRDAGSFSNVLCLVADDAPEGLALALATRHEPGVAVELRDRVLGGGLRSRGLIHTRSVYLGELARLPDADWLADAGLHLAYSDLPIVGGVSGGGVGLERVPASGLEGTLMTAEMFGRFVCGGERAAALNAL